MKYLLVAPIEEPVPPRKYGGTELVIYNLAEQLVEDGHEVTLLATGDSITSAELVEAIPMSLRRKYPSDEELEQWRAYYKFNYVPKILKTIEEVKPDIVHNHYSWRLLAFADFINVPIMTTSHGPITSLHEKETYRAHAKLPYVSISDNQRLACPEINWVGTVYNGIDVDAFEVGPALEDREYFAFLGRTSPEKGLKEICEMIRRTDKKLKIAAKVDPVDVAYFEEEIEPLVDGEQIEFIGEIGHEEKVEFLKHAKALLLWLNWEEPFGLVVAEAMACGTPVIVNPRGSMPELLTPEVGFLVGSLDEMKNCLNTVGTIDPKACVTHVKKHFSSESMARGYIELAEKLIHDVGN